MPHPISFTALTICTKHSISFFNSTRPIMVFTFLGLCHPCVLMQILMFEVCYPHIASFQHRTTPLFSHFHSLLELQKHQLYRLSPYLQSIHSGLPAPNLYPFPSLSIVLSESFQNVSLSSSIPSLRPYPITTQTLIHRILELTHPKSITALCHISFSIS